jgi:hypothetical protein
LKNTNLPANTSLSDLFCPDVSKFLNKAYSQLHSQDSSPKTHTFKSIMAPEEKDPKFPQP